MKFKDFKYERPDMHQFKVDFEALIEKFNDATSPEAQLVIIKEINAMRNHIESLSQIVQIRHTIDTTDAFYDAENDFIDDAMPLYMEMVDKYYRALDQSKFKDALRKELGDHIFNIIEVKLKTFHTDIIEDLKTENMLASKYTKLRTSAKIMFDGEERNLAQMVPYYESKDRLVRKEAQEAATKFFEENEAAFDDLYQDLVEVRHKIARKLGFDNFIKLGYMRLSRTDYDDQMVATYRKQVQDELVPLSLELRKRQEERLRIDTLKYYDEQIAFTSGNATPKGDSEWIIENGKKMYEELSAETGEFINFMLDSELMDLEAKKGKTGGGYCTYISDYRAPFIFSNFNGTSGDIDVLTHEAGHAFQCFQSRDYELPEYQFPTLEACEIHSMSMEFLTYPWMESFFKDEVTKYKFNHVSEALLFIPYGVLVDEFQHFVYGNPEATPADRKAKWRELEKKYQPYKNYEDNDFLERGGYWFRQGHIFSNPFYYIDYTLAQVCAFQFFLKSTEDRKSAWDQYLKLCNMGGSLPFTGLLKVAGLDSPFEEGSIKKVIPALRNVLGSIDDRNL
ncbi:M3 family oligoendopeptidase [Fusibacter bizertensis]|uniref:M3 family oligoendopeptidase n=1 Tax=Fusibacter bizertensis TaxID=1488331 RepID=A0ABT6NG85_9FIRM|nr:M3 family oligoendopeptidase [Fusibacter bizertensis]MDH8679444.1 M3 family oligoendopeptidase [Fusibacter bizertensis]